jgi:hypothetical protein
VGNAAGGSPPVGNPAKAVDGQLLDLDVEEDPHPTGPQQPHLPAVLGGQRLGHQGDLFVAHLAQHGESPGGGRPELLELARRVAAQLHREIRHGRTQATADIEADEHPVSCLRASRARRSRTTQRAVM